MQIIHNPRYAGAFVFGRRQQRQGPDEKPLAVTALGGVDPHPRRARRLHHVGQV